MFPFIVQSIGYLSNRGGGGGGGGSGDSALDP